MRMSLVRMTGLACIASAAMLLLASASGNAGYAREPKSDGEAAKAQAHVEAALRAELAGKNDERNSLLKQALKTDPDCAPAHWQSGEMHLGGKWLPVKDAQRAAVDDKLLKEYREMRAGTPNEPGAQQRIARWCEANNLMVESRAHWYNVLRFEPQNKHALGALRVEYYQGELLTKEEIERRNEEAKEQRRIVHQWRPKLLEIRRDVASEDVTRRRQAREQLHAIDDPAVIPLLEMYFSGESRDAAIEVVETLGGMKHHDATLSLLRHASYSQWIGVREAAAKQLAMRPMHDYVPLLLDQLVPPVEAGFRIKAFPGGSTYTQVYSQEGPFSRRVLVDTQVETLTLFVLGIGRHRGTVRSVRSASPLPVDPFNFQIAAMDNQLKVADVNRRLRDHNERFLSVLRETTDQNKGDSPINWWQWWQEYSENHQPAQKPVFIQVRGQQHNYSLARLTLVDCFLAGTKVWTQTGLVPIETIELGDQVLAQDPGTGELAFKPVLATTLRPPAEMLELNFAGEPIKTTRGHPFWLDGTGWRMAKLLEPGGIVRALHGGVTLDSITPAPTAGAHSLVVADFHNYFVGETGILVHDNTPRTPTEAVVPGLKERVEK